MASKRTIQDVLAYSIAYQAKIRAQVIQALGGRCSNFNCRWQNADGSFGCDDPRALQIDHPNGGGTQHRKQVPWHTLYKEVLANPQDFDLLCATCNWIKRAERKEATGNPHAEVKD